MPALLLAAAGCTGGEPEAAVASNGLPVCHIEQPPAPLPAQIPESSGAAVSRTHAGVVWTHNDSGNDPDLFAVDAGGRLLGQMRVTGADNVDWEDISLAPCGDRECLYIADIGDNAARRDDLAIYRLPEPEPGSARTAPAERFPIRYPDGPRDAEAIFILPDGALFVITKGRESPVALYRYPPPMKAGETVELEPVRLLSRGPVPLFDQVTGADAARDGSRIAVRTYASVLLYEAEALLEGGDPVRIDVDPAGEAQGEGIGLGPDGFIVLTSEAFGDIMPGSIATLRCTLEGRPFPE